MQTKRQHYVPQFLLRYFTSEGNRLYVFDKHKYETRAQSVRNSAVEKYFYNYQEVVTSRSLAPVTKSEQRALAFFVATQMLRTRHEREYSKRHWDTLKQAVLKILEFYDRLRRLESIRAELTISLSEQQLPSRSTTRLQGSGMKSSGLSVA